MPSVDVVLQKMPEPGDRFVAFRELATILETISPGFNVSPDQNLLLGQYATAKLRAIQELGPARLETYSGPTSDAFRDRLLGILSPEIRERLDAQRSSDEAAREAAIDKAHGKAGAGEENQQAIVVKSRAATGVDLESADGAHVDRKIFGIVIGEPLRLRDCPTSVSPWAVGNNSSPIACKLPEGDSSFGLFFGPEKLPDWVGGTGLGWHVVGSRVQAKLTGGLVTGVSVDVLETDEFVEQMRAKYGKKPLKQTRTFTNTFGRSWSAASLLEWRLPGLYVKFELAETQRDASSPQGVLVVETASSFKAKQSKEETQKANQLKP